MLIKLTNSIGRQKAHKILSDLTREDNFNKAVKNHPQVKSLFSEIEIDEILDPISYIGLAPELVDLVVESVERKMNKE